MIPAWLKLFLQVSVLLLILVFLWLNLVDDILSLSADTVNNTSGQSSLAPQEPIAALVHGSVDVPEKVVREVTAYTASVEETDSEPCVGAAGFDICEIAESGLNVCASNAFPIGTFLTVEGLGDCVVFDRMNSRYQNRVDWFMGYDKERAIQFGLQKLYVTDRGIYE